MRNISTSLWAIGALTMGLASVGYAQPSGTTAPASAKTAPQAKVSAGSGCLVADFRTIGLSVHNPSERHDRAWNWLHTNAKRCSLEQLKTVSNNRASWLGSADSPEIMGLVDAIIEYRSLGDDDKLQALYNSKPVEVAESKVVTGLPERPAPLVQPGVGMAPSGVYVQGAMPPPMPYPGPGVPVIPSAPQAGPGTAPRVR